MTTVGTLICYTPFIIWIQWFMVKVNQEKSHKILNSTGKVLFCFIARMGVQAGCIINPFIYATTIPKFKEFVNSYLRWSKYTTVNTATKQTTTYKSSTQQKQ